MKNFLVYKSSAGSGKTTTLVKEYLKLTLPNPSLFKSVLAITFTNKAANEMKTRILETLRNIISGNFDDYLVKEIIAETNMESERLLNNAALLQFNINHHYDDFSVSTIDSFVHKIIRTFASDLELPQNFEVVIDDDDFIPFIVEDIYKNVGLDPDFTKILTEFVISKVEEEKSHNITDTLSGFVKNQMQEENFFQALLLEHLKTGDFLKIIAKLKTSYFAYKKKLSRLGNEALETITGVGLQTDDFSGKSKNGVISYFTKAKNLIKVDELSNPGPDMMKSAYKAFENDEGWYKKGTDTDVVEKMERIKPVLTDYYKEIKKTAKEYLLRYMIFKNIYQVVLVHQIRSLFKDFIERTQKVPISEFNKKIASEIAGQPVPYIYERLGVRYRHFLIDEFQDTSVLQWNNLLPLVEESLANGKFNMIVGDAKQAIYRFRGGEVELFTSLPELYGVEDTPENRIREQVLQQNFISKPLDVNYRSHNEIIRFNNEFFEVAKKVLSAGFVNIYDNHKQKIPAAGKEGGFVSLRFIRNKNARNYRDKKLVEIAEIVSELNAKGYSFGDIAVLCRKNSDATEIASYLLQNKIPVVSSESVKLVSSVRVRFIVAFLKYIVNNDDAVNLSNLIYLFLRLQNRKDDFGKVMMSEEISFNGIIKSYGLERIDFGRLQPLDVYEICEEVIRHFFGNEPLDAFVRFFLDFVLERRPLHLGDVNGFLELWEAKKDKLSITLPENGNAVNILTAHKSKGLKFGVVIVDLENFDKKYISKKQFWYKVEIEEVAPLKKTIFDIGKNLAAIDKGDVYEKETAKTKLDELNLIYVAFTRPVYALYALGSVNEKGNPGIFASYLKNFLETKGEWSNEKESYEYGVLPDPPESDVNGETTELLTAIPRKLWQEGMTLSSPELKPLTSLHNAGEREYGNMLHNVMAEIYSANDTGRVLEAFQMRGLVSESVARSLKQTIDKIVFHPQLKPLFEKGVEAKNESELFDFETGNVFRPDRIVFGEKGVTVIDYKTGTKENSHIKQIKNYGKIISQTGFDVHKLLLVYIENNNVEVYEVTDG